MRRRRGLHAVAHRFLPLLALVAVLSPGASLSAATGSSAITLDAVSRIGCLQTLPGHANTLLGVAFSADGRFFASSTGDGVVQLWDRATWHVIREFSAPALACWRVHFLADNARIASGNGTVWDIATGQLVHSLGRGIYIALSLDGTTMAIHNNGQFTIQLLRTTDWRVECEIATGCPGDFVAYSPDGRLVALAANQVPNGPDLAVKLFDTATGEVVHTLRGHRSILHGLAFSPDGRWVAGGSMDTTIRVWDVETGELVHTLQTRGGLFDVAFSPDSSLIAGALDNRTVELWDVANGRWVRTLEHQGEVVSLAFSPDGTLLASGAYDSRIYLWGVSL